MGSFPGPTPAPPPLPSPSQNLFPLETGTRTRPGVAQRPKRNVALPENPDRKGKPTDEFQKILKEFRLLQLEAGLQWIAEVLEKEEKT
jgi:hypothetical protein